MFVIILVKTGEAPNTKILASFASVFIKDGNFMCELTNKKTLDPENLGKGKYLLNITHGPHTVHYIKFYISFYWLFMKAYN